MMHYTVMFLLVCLTFPLYSLQEYNPGNYYQKINGYKMNAPLSQINTYLSTGITVSVCASRCSIDSTCNSFSISSQSDTCVFFSEIDLTDMSGSWLRDAAWDTWIHPVPEAVNNSRPTGNWTLVFRGTPHIGSSMYDTFMNTSHDEKYEPGCMRMDNALPCQSHFRSPVLNTWTNIDQVRLSLYKNSTEQQYIVFDGVGSTITSWFKKSSIVQSSYSQILSKTYDIFSIKGIPTRRFYIDSHHIDCDGSSGYLNVLDTETDSDTCTWRQKIPPPEMFPLILYSSNLNGGPTTWSNINFDIADVLAIWVTFTP